jgi:hypothetical protein
MHKGLQSVKKKERFIVTVVHVTCILEVFVLDLVADCLNP